MKWIVIRKRGNEDRRTKYTKKVIHEAYCDLLKKKPYKKITVKEICEIADINRSTFYLHYADCSSVMEEIENDVLTLMMEKIVDSYQKGTSSYDLTMLFVNLFQQEQFGDFCAKVTFGIYGTGRVQERLQSKFAEFFAPQIASFFDIAEKEVFLMLNFLAGGIIPFTKHWYENGFQNISEELLLLDKLINTTFTAFGIDFRVFLQQAKE